MCFLSSLDVVHRDLSARNILIDVDKQAKIADFGLARNVEKGYAIKEIGQFKCLTEI